MYSFIVSLNMYKYSPTLLYKTVTLLFKDSNSEPVNSLMSFDGLI